jgi:signal transduction histidine kinase
LIEEYTGLANRLQEVEEYDREARRKLEVMSSLGVVAGFLTHEATRLITALDRGLRELRMLSKQHPSLQGTVDSIEETYTALSEHIDYTRTFIDAVHSTQLAPFKAAAQIKRVMKKFGAFAKARNIDVACEVKEELTAPAMPVTVYSGVLLNLYSNALKAIIASTSAQVESRIVFRGWNEAKWHCIEVLDTGIGIPPEIRSRIWDPLFTTTSRLNNPLGSGMGLGLTLVKQLVTQMRGRIDLVDPPAGFSTCFRVKYPREAKE